MLPSRNRLKEKKDFRILFRLGKRIELGPFGLVCYLNGQEESRFAVVVRRTFGKAVERNRAKRRGRHLLKEIEGMVAPPCDMVFLPRKGFLESGDGDLKKRIREGVLKLGFMKEE